jgi:hypothetical protein
VQELPQQLEDVPLATQQTVCFMHDGAPAQFNHDVKQFFDSTIQIDGQDNQTICVPVRILLLLVCESVYGQTLLEHHTLSTTNTGIKAGLTINFNCFFLFTQNISIQLQLMGFQVNIPPSSMFIYCLHH